MVDIGKSIIPSKVSIHSPLNEGSDFKTGNYVVFRIGKGDMDMWLTNDSYLTFNLKVKSGNKFTYKAKEALTTTSTYELPQLFIRNACNIFDRVEVTYEGKNIYTQPYNIERSTIETLRFGESYLNANFATYTTNKMISDGTAYLKIGKSSVKLSSAVAKETTFESEIADDMIITNVLIPFNQLVPLFSDVTSDGFPIKCLKSDFEFRFYIANPSKYLCEYDYSIPDFATTGLNKSKNIESSNSNNFRDAIQLETVRLVCNSYIPDDCNMVDFTNKCQKGWMFKSQLWNISLRQVSKIEQFGNKIPFVNTTENTRSLLAYCYRNSGSPAIMYRPNIHSLKLTFGSNSIPTSTTIGSTYTHPFNYKFFTDDVFDNIDNYHGESNRDFNLSYQYIANDATTVNVPTSSFVIIGANFSGSQQLGANSSNWNSKYDLEFNGTKEDSESLTFVFSVLTDYGMLIKDGNVQVINL